MSNYTAIKWITWKKQTDSNKIQSSNTEPGRNRNYEQLNYEHYNQRCDQKSTPKPKAQDQMASQQNSINI